jgi:hypothetical protein
MLNAHAICRLLIDDEQPVPQPDDPRQMGLDFNADELLDPKSEIMRYAETPFRIPGSGPTDLYQKLQNRLGGRPRRKIENNTYVLDHGDRLAVRLHQTDVVTAYPDGRIVVDSGGWRPGGGKWAEGWRNSPGRTTMDRIEGHLSSGWHIYKKQDNWFWYNNATKRGNYEDNIRIPYDDGDTIFPDGSLQTKQAIVHVKQRKKRTR